MPFPGYYDPTATQVAASKRPYGGLSSKLWRDVPETVVANNPDGNYARMFSGADLADFIALTASGTNDYVTCTEVNNGTTGLKNAIAGATGPVLEMDTASTTDLDGHQIQFLKMGVTPTDGWDIYFEARIAQTDIGGTTVSSSAELFAGLASSDATIMAGTTPTATDWIGFYTALADGAVTFGVGDATTRSVTSSAAHTLVDLDQVAAVAQVPSAWVKVGFVLRGTADSGEYYVNGVRGEQSVTWTSAPDAVVYPSFVCQSNATTDPITYINWFKIAQIRSGH